MAIFALGNEILKDRHDLLVQISEMVSSHMEEISSIDLLGVKIFRADIHGVERDQWCTFRFRTTEYGLRIGAVTTKDFEKHRINSRTS